ncbi:PilZ domain-containing protein [bacterium]|nr:PilZ domain-containing protein [bacterium]
MRDQRKFKRKLIEVVTHFRYNDVDEFIQEHLRDISLGGMFIKTSHPKRLNEKIYFKFSIDQGITLIEGYGKVVWANEEGMGIEFISLDEKSRALIETMLEIKDNLK